MLTIENQMIRVELDEEQHRLHFIKDGELWELPESGTIECIGEDEDNGEKAGDLEYSFLDAEDIHRETFSTGIGQGMRFVYRNLGGTGYSFETLIRLEDATGDVYLEWIPLQEEGLKVRKVHWPMGINFCSVDPSDITVLPLRQGLLIPNNWPNVLEKPAFDGQFQTAGCYMPWFGQIHGRTLPNAQGNGRGPGYIAISMTPWDAGVDVIHPANGMDENDLPLGTAVGQWLIPSLGKMGYRRILRYTFLEDCDLNTLCKVYRTYVNEQGKLVTLAQKAVRNPSVRDLEKCSFVHTGIKTKVQPDSDFYDAENPGKNDHLHTFAEREQQIRDLHAAGAGKIYLHLDGWAEPGYDNNHPDYGPICEEAGGPEGMLSLDDTLHQYGDLFGIHDQYRDYYRSADSFDEHYAVTNEDGSIPQHQRWAGGPQSYLCASQAPYYVRRNFLQLFEEGIVLDGAYLDVFTCNEADECFEAEHRMSRRECYEFRGKCFEYLLSQGILSSSEEVGDWTVPSLVFCHYAPYEFQMLPPDAPQPGIPVPLYNLVYHDCVLQPQPMDRIAAQGRDDMLYALLDGQPPYLVRDPAYENIDGAFTADKLSAAQQALRCRIVSDFAASVAEEEMVSCEFLNRSYTRVRTTFASGRSVTVDLKKRKYYLQASTDDAF